jgi:cytoskeletal protein CcmA (bactofilin family)
MDPRDLPQSDLVTVLAPDAKFKGELTLEGAGRIHGTFEGTIRAGEIQIGEGATCHANIEGGTIVIEGMHQGDLVARDCLQLSNKANVQGDVTATSLAVAQGATFIGRCIVGPDALANASRLVAESKNGANRNKPAQARAAEWIEPAAAPAPAAPTTPAPDWLGQPAPTINVRPWVNTPTAAA